MFGKHGRGGGSGRGSVKRPLSGPVQLQRPVVVGGSRPPIGVSAAAARARHGAPGAPAATAASAPGREETYSLEPGELDFGAIIRLTPDLVDEIRRLEAQGASTRIKFDSNANNSAGNVIDVGGKEFRFTWSREPTDLCDIYEERQNGEDRDGLLVECGSAWRKLNVQRILDESTKNHVKMRSEEAERLLKSRKVLVLDPTNPSVKNQAKSMVAAAVEGNMRRMSWKHKKEMFFKKRKVEPNQGAVTVAQPKSIFKSTTASNGIKGIQSSPGPSPPQQPIPHTSLSPAGPGNTLRGDANPGEITPLNITKEEIQISEKGRPTRVARSSMQEINGYKGGTTDPPIDLQSMLRTLLSQNPKGMSLKALEKAVGEKTTNSVKKIENVLKNIATFQAPGRYFLKQEGQVECSKRTESGSSPECSNKHAPKTASILSVKASDERLNQETELRSKYEEESDLFERIDIVRDTEDPLSVDGKAYDDSKLREGSSSESGSDSDSESDSSDSGSDSGSQSRSRSKSKSPAGSGSSSSSDSESDGSSSKEASDVDVDIMTSDDEKGVTVQRIETTEPRFSSSPRAWRFDGEHDESDTNERDQKESTISPTLDLTDFESTYERAMSAADTKNLPIDRSAKSFENLEARTTVENIDTYLQKSKCRFSADGIDFPPNHNKVTENQHVSHFGDSGNDKDKIYEGKALNKGKNMMNDRTGYAQSDNHERVPKTNSKRSNSEYFQEKPEKAKRVKASSSAEAYFGKVKRASSSENSYYVSPEKSQHMDQTVKVNNNLQRDENRKIDLLEERPDEQATESSRHNVAESIVRKKAFDMEKPNKYVEILGRTNKHTEAICGSPESDAYAVKNKLVKDKISAVKEKPDENGYTPAEYRTKNVKDSILGEKTSSAPEQVNRKSNEGYPSQLSNSDVNGKGNVLRRELSDLELGELREPPGDAMGEEDERQFERKNSFKKMENKVTVSDLDMGKCNENAVSESKKQSPPNSRGVNEKVLADDSIDLAQFQSRLVQPQSRQSARVDFAGSTAMAQVDKCAESGGKNGMRTDQLVSAENQASEPKKSATNIVSKDNHRPQCLSGCKNVKDTKSTKSNGFKGSADQGSDGFLIDNGFDSRKCAEFSLDEENALYMKYEKEELDLRGPIMDFSKYKEYVQEYQEKYTHYCSLSKKLEKTRIDFLKVGDDIQLARGRDVKEYYSLVEKLRRMYHQCGDRHKRMKKIFILLHEELKTLKQRIKDFADLHLGK